MPTVSVRPRAVVVTLALGLMVAGCGINAIPTQEEKAKAGWSEVLNQYQRRSDLIPNLVDVVKGYAGHERQLLQQVTELRGAARALPSEDVARRAEAEGALSIALGRLIALAESYPDLKASGNFLELQQELSRLESEIQMARRYYNGSVRNLNTLVESFPSNLVAGLFGFVQRQFFEISDAADRAVPRVALEQARPER